MAQALFLICCISWLNKYGADLGWVQAYMHSALADCHSFSLLFEYETNTVGKQHTNIHVFIFIGIKISWLKCLFSAICII